MTASVEAAPVRAPLARRDSGRVLAGVVAGIAAWLGAPAGFLRLLLMAATVRVPWLVAVYVAAALLLPAEGARLGWENLVFAGRLAALLGVLWVALTVLAVPRIGAGPEAWVPLGGLAVVAFVGLMAGGERRRDARARRDVVLGTGAVLGLAVCFGLALVLVPGVRWERWLALPVLAAGVAIVLGARRDMVRALVVPAAVLAVTALILVAAGARLDGGVGDLTVSAPPAPVGDVVARRAFGDVRLDLTALRPGAQPVTAVASVGVGDLTVILPRGAAIDLDARAGRGELAVSSYIRTDRSGPFRRDGLDVRLATHLQPLRPGSTRAATPRVRLRLRVDSGLGDIHIDSAGNEELR